jgi:hypothetical protein
MSGAPIISQTTIPLMGHKDAKRIVTRLTDGTVLLKEIFPTSNGTIEKEKLVHLYPDRLMWVATHVSGPIKHSQFIYQITAEGKGSSRLDFNALYIEYNENFTQKGLKELSEELCRGDSEMWKLLAEAMKKELKP